jgi:hypothetical protein
MKTILLTCVLLVGLTASANAQGVHFSFGIGVPVVPVAPAPQVTAVPSCPVTVAPTYSVPVYGAPAYSAPVYPYGYYGYRYYGPRGRVVVRAWR